MCGIAALFSNQVIDSKYIKNMTDSIKHRGPDSEGQACFCDGKVWLGHRRLAILDLSDDGKQPMSYADGRYWITYNGEIYNYIEIRQELERYGLKFRTKTDTEVVLAAYSFWGKECLERFNGMWAFVIVDLEDNKVFAARDRFGVKPLYYWYSSQNMLAVASEIKQFTVLPGWIGKINGQRAYDFLRWSQLDHTAETMFEGVYQLCAGMAAEFTFDKLESSFTQFRWYRLKAGTFDGDLYDAVNIFKERFFDAVSLRLRSDVKIGGCLSGGLDSSSIVCTVNEILRAQNKIASQRTVSAGARVEKYDESYYINEVLRSRGIKGYYVYPEMNNLFDVVDDITWHQDEPFGSTSIYAQWEVFKIAARNKLIVMLDGQGADEQLAGYHTFFAPRFAGLFKTLNWWKLYCEIKKCDEVHNYTAMFAIKGMISQLLPEPVVNLFRRVYNDNEAAPSWLDLKKLKAESINPSLFTGAKTSSVRDLSIAQLTASNLQQLLHCEDRDSMAHSIESRLPFLDYRLLEFVLSLPDEFKISEGVTKRILRESMKGILPETVRMRMTKLGFATPEEVWLKEYPDTFEVKLKEIIEMSDGIVTPKCLVYLNDVISGKRKFDFTLWRMISFGTWLKRFDICL